MIEYVRVTARTGHRGFAQRANLRGALEQFGTQRRQFADAGLHHGHLVEQQGGNRRIRLRRIRDPQIRFGRYAAARFLCAIWQVYAMVHGASAVVLAFTVVEIGFSLAQSLPLRDVQEAPAGASERRNFSAS